MSLNISVLISKQLFRKSKPIYLSACINSKCLCTSSFKYVEQKTLQNVQLPKHVVPYINQPVETILSTVDPRVLSISETISILKALRMHILFKTDYSKDFKSNKNFELLCELFQNNCITLKPSLLVSGLRSLLEIGLPPDSKYVTSAEKHILEKIESFTVFDLISCLYFHHKFLETDLQKEVVSVLIEKLYSEISKVSTAAEVLMLVHFCHLFSEEYKKDVQDKIIQVIPTLSIYEMSKVLSTLSSNSDRNIYILHTISFYLRQNHDDLQPKTILDILYSFKKLNFFDTKLLHYLFKLLQREVPSVTQQSIISGILTTCGQLKWKQKDLLKACSDWIINHKESCRAKEYTSYIITTAALSYYELEPLKNIVPHLSKDKVHSPDVWLDTVWSLAVHDFNDKSMLENILTSEFYKKLNNNTSNVIKLLNLKAMMKTQFPECIFKCDLFLQPPVITQNAETESKRKHVLNVLSNLVPKDKYLCTNQNTDLGIFIDAEFIMDENAKPVPLANYGTLTSSSSEVKPLPKGLKRIVLQILFYKDYTLQDQSPVGSITLAKNILTKLGYTVVLVSFDEFQKKETEIQKAKYLLQKIKKSF